MSPDQVHPVPVVGKKLHIDYAVLLAGDVVPEAGLWLLEPVTQIYINDEISEFV